MTPAALAAVALDLDSWSVEQVSTVNIFARGFTDAHVYVGVPLTDWLQVVDHAYDLDSGELPAGSASLVHDLVQVSLKREGYTLSSSVRLADLGDVEDVLHLMGVAELEAWKALAAVAA